MLLNELQISNNKKLAKINKALKESFGFTLVSTIEPNKLNSLYKKISNDLYSMKLNLGTPKAPEYTKQMLVLEGLKILINESEHDMAASAAYQRVLGWLKEYVRKAMLVGDPESEAIYDAMKQYNSSKYRWPSEKVRADLEFAVAGVEETLGGTLAGAAIGGALGGPVGAFRGASIGHMMTDESVEEDDTCRGCGDAGAFASGLCKKCAEDTYGDRDVDESTEINEDPGHSILDIITPEELEELRQYIRIWTGTGDITMVDSDFYGSPVYEKLFDYYAFGQHGPEDAMPYGVAKGREGPDSDEWILNKVVDDYPNEVGEELDEAGYESAAKARAGERKWVSDMSPKDDGDIELSLGDDETGDEDDYYSYNARKTKMKEGYVRKLRKLLEAEVDQAESLIAARSFSQELQDMFEKLGRLVNENLPAVSEQMRDAYGADVATGFEDTVSGTLTSVMDSLRDSKQSIDNSVESISTGGVPAAGTDMDDMEDFGDEGDMDVDLDTDVDLDLDDSDLGDEFGGADAAAGPMDEPLGRAKKESVRNMRRQMKALQEQINRAKAKHSRRK